MDILSVQLIVKCRFHNTNIFRCFIKQNVINRVSLMLSNKPTKLNFLNTRSPKVHKEESLFLKGSSRKEIIMSDKL